jgi:hypothetical protein
LTGNIKDAAHTSHIAASNGGVRVTAIRNGRKHMNRQQQTTLHDNQMSLLDVLAARDEALARVEANANEEWKRVAYVTALEVAERKHRFTSDDVWDALTHVSTHEPRAMGAVMKRLHKEGHIQPTSDFITSTSPRSHGRPVRVWQYGTQRALENDARSTAHHSDPNPWN